MLVLHDTALRIKVFVIKRGLYCEFILLSKAKATHSTKKQWLTCFVFLIVYWINIQSSLCSVSLPLT